MKKLLTTCALIAVGGIAAIAGGSPKELTGVVSKQSGPKFTIMTEAGEAVKFNVWKGWKKMYTKASKIAETGEKVTLTLKYNKKNELVLDKVHD